MTSNYNGRKDDTNKLRMDLIPYAAFISMAEVLGFGCKKYEEHNWRKGIKHSRLYAATLRHLTAYWAGETLDKESGLNHLGHAMVNIAMILETQDNKELDNRYVENRKKKQPDDRESRTVSVAAYESDAMGTFAPWLK